MKPRRVLKIGVDVAMTMALLLLMAYEWIGRVAHEWIGIAMFALLVLHHILNRKWSKSVLNGRYTFLRALQTGLVLAVLLCMVGSMVSGVILSRYAFASGLSLEHDDGNGEKVFRRILWKAYMATSDCGRGARCLWRFRLCTAGNRQLYVPEK